MKLICLGDSLTYGLGTPVEDCWVELINRESGWDVVNKGVSGDTSGGMLARFDRDVLGAGGDGVLLMGGSNDFIMGCEPSIVKANIMALVHQARACKLKVLVCAEPAGDTAHIRNDWQGLTDFFEVDRKLAQMSAWLGDFCTVFRIPFIGLHDRFGAMVAGHESEYFFDGVHPNRRGHRLMADIILESEAFLRL